MNLNEYFDELVKIQIAEEKFVNEINESLSLRIVDSIVNIPLETSNSKPEKPEIKSETNIDWNFVLGLFLELGI